MKDSQNQRNEVSTEDGNGLKMGVELEFTIVWGEGQSFGSKEGKLVARRLGCSGCGGPGRLFQNLLKNRESVCA